MCSRQRHGTFGTVHSDSTVSRYQILAEMPKHKASVTSLHWKTSLQTQKGHALMQWHYVAGQWARLYVLESHFAFFAEVLHNEVIC